MIFTNKMISLEIALSKNGVFALSLTVHHRILDILGYASFETYSFEECPWNMWKSMNFLKSICLGLTCLGVSQTWGMKIHAAVSWETETRQMYGTHAAHAHVFFGCSDHTSWVTMGHHCGPIISGAPLAYFETETTPS